MRQRRLLVMALAWVAIVAAVATVTFIVVDRAGRGVGQASGAPALPDVASSTGTPVTPTPTATVGSPGSTATDTGPTASAGVTRTESFITAGGTLVASCDGEQVTLESITVRDGWRFEQESEGGRLEVKFESRQDDDAEDAELRLACVGGTPTPVDN